MKPNLIDATILVLTGVYFSSRLNEGRSDNGLRALIGVGTGLTAGYFGLDAFRKVKQYISTDASEKLLKLGLGATAGAVAYGLSDKVLDAVNNYKNNKKQKLITP